MAPRLVFAGTPAFAVPSLSSLLESEFDIVGVFTQPDRPAGRGRRLTASPVKQLAERTGLAVHQPHRLQDSSVLALLEELDPAVMVVAAYGLILPPSVLAIPAHGCVNVHASLLPRWRGAAPIARAIEAGDAHTGISLMQMEAGLDTGPVLATARIPIEPDDTAAGLHDRLADLGARLLVEKLPAYLAGELPGIPQDHSQATYAGKLQREEAVIDWNAPAAVVSNKIRAFNPWPVAETRIAQQRLRIWHAMPVAERHHAQPGTVLQADSKGLIVACSEGGVSLTRLQRIGGKVLAPREFLNGFPIATGTRCG